MGQEANVNVKEASFRSNFNVKEGVKRSSTSQDRIRRNQRIADDLTRKFGTVAKGSYKYLCKCANNMTENQIWSIYEQAMRPKVANHWAYFLAATKAQPGMA